MKITLHRSDYDKIVAYAQENFPEEACGLLAGTEGEEEVPADANATKTHKVEVRHIEKIYLLSNVDHSREHFTMDPREQLSAIKDMRASGLKSFGNWHSHPETMARPSDEDKRLAFDSRATYMILTLMDRNSPLLHAYHIENGNSSPEELVIIPD